MARIDALLGDAEDILILGHVHPDGDCVGSCLGLWNYLKDRYPDRHAEVVLEPFSPSFLFLRGAEEISHVFPQNRHARLCICMDASDIPRLGEGAALLEQADRSVCIDHHITNTGFAEENIVRADASSASEVLMDLMDPDAISRETAECLYLGIVHDTGVFKHSNTSEQTMRMAGALLSKGVSSSRIIDDTFYRKTFAQNRVLGKALLQAELLAGGKVIASILTEEEMKSCGADKGDMDGIIDQLRVTEGVEMAVLLYETEPGSFKISLRSNELVDVSRIAARWEGGGHVRAAGGRTGKDPRETVAELAALAEEQMENNR